MTLVCGSVTTHFNASQGIDSAFDELRAGGAMKVVYGAVTIQVERCPDCGDRAFVMDGLLQCCLAPAPRKTKGIYRGCGSDFKRRMPSQYERGCILAKQSGRCAYCRASFGDVAFRKKKAVVLRPCWDHVEPYCWQANNLPVNFVAACVICNNAKGSKLFGTLEEARSYVWRKRKKAGWEAATERPPEEVV